MKVAAATTVVDNPLNYAVSKLEKVSEHGHWALN
jgi:hypothetical protein